MVQGVSTGGGKVSEIVTQQTLVVVTCWCGMRHAIPKELDEFCHREHRDGKSHTVYCPLGHTYSIAGEGESKRLARELAQERAKHDQTKAALRSADTALVSERKKSASVAKRVGNGVCPCCNRSFVNLQRHMKTKHPKFKDVAPNPTSQKGGE
jgi:hypothetical protein